MIIEHGVVFSDPSLYAGWPANHGAWQWGNEMLVGFLVGKYDKKPMHNIKEPYTKMLARSTDGGITWEANEANVDFNCLKPRPLDDNIDLRDSILRICGVYDHGGDTCDERGGFYTSNDRGHTWKGAFLFSGLKSMFPGDGELLNTSRTCVLDSLVFLSRGYAKMWGTDMTFCALYDDSRFRFQGLVCSDSARAVMPAAARIGDRIVVVLRRRKSGVREGWLDAFGSENGGRSWRFLSRVASTGHHNGNPPALITTNDGRLCCVFGNRDEGSICYVTSSDAGETWTSPTVLRASETDDVDVGYPRLFRREDGALIAVYYFISQELPQQHIARTVFSI